MNEKNYPVIYNPEHYTVMANDIIHGKQDMTLQEARILRLLITQVVKEDKDFKTFTCSIKDLANFLDIPKNNLYRDIYTILSNLSRRIVKIGTGNMRQPWEIFSWISLAKYDGQGNITLRLSDQIKPYVLELNSYFTQYQLENILEMKSFYAIRLYELLKSDFYKETTEYIEYMVQDLRQFFECENKYKLFADFKKRVIDTAILEINNKSDIEIRGVEYIKRGRKTDRVRFWVGYNFSVNEQRKLSKQF